MGLSSELKLRLMSSTWGLPVIVMALIFTLGTVPVIIYWHITHRRLRFPEISYD